MVAMLTLSFINDALNFTIRGMRTDAGVERFSVYDFINTVCAKDISDCYGRITFTRMVKAGAKYKDELDKFTIYLQFPGVFSRKTVVTQCHNCFSAVYVVIFLEYFFQAKDKERLQL